MTLLVMLAAGSCDGCAQRVKARGAAAGSGGAGYPVGDPGEVAGQGGENVALAGNLIRPGGSRYVRWYRMLIEVACAVLSLGC